MIKEINLSQLLALIAVSGSVKQIKVGDGDLAWRKDADIDVTKNSHMLCIKWDRSEYFGPEKQYLCMMLHEMRQPCPWNNDSKYLMPVLHAYYYHGDNCNRRTKFIYEILGNEIDIIDDIWVVGNGGAYNRRNLLKIDPNEVYAAKVNNLDRSSLNFRRR